MLAELAGPRGSLVTPPVSSHSSTDPSLDRAPHRAPFVELEVWGVGLGNVWIGAVPLSATYVGLWWYRGCSWGVVVVYGGGMVREREGELACPAISESTTESGAIYLPIKNNQTISQTNKMQKAFNQASIQLNTLA